MKKTLLLFILSLPVLANSQAPPKPYGALPSAAQLKWHEMEMYCLIHFGVDTYTDKEWGFGDEDPAILNPVKFDATQIVSAVKAGGFKGVVVVAKHHDGLCLWPTKTTEHNITKSPWRNGKGDMLKEYQAACNKLGMKLGLYCSPWDRNNAKYGSQEYVAIYRQQLRELYSHYGPLFISWHDGANGGDGFYGGQRGERKIDRTSYYGWDSTFAITRKMQPTAVIFGDIGPDVRWVGNEEGFAGATCWATYTPEAPDEGKKPANGYVKYWLGTEGIRNGKYWMPAECDVPLRSGWFYHASQDEKVKSPATLLDLYYKSVGRGANLDLGIAPNRDGLLPANDVKALQQFGALLKQTFAVNLAKGATFTASNIRGKNAAKYGPAFLTDNDRYSYWATDDKVLDPELVIDLGKPQTFNVIRLRENIKLGQRIDSVVIDVWEDNEWKQMATATSIGANRLIRLPQPVTATKVRLRIIKAAACIALSDFGLFKEPNASSSNNEYDRESSAKALSQSGWKIYGPAARSNNNKIELAIDGNASTFFNSLTDAGTVFWPQEIIVDMGKTNTVTAFTYLPRQDKKTDGMVDKYSYAVSQDGEHWEQVATGEFANIKANPIEQIVSLDHPVAARYFKFSALHVVGGNGISVAELGCLK